jgi:hypothetical protein
MQVEETLTTSVVFERDRYVVLPSLLTNPLLSQFYRYARQTAQLGRKIGDSQVEGTPCAYSDFMMDGLLVDLLPEIERASGVILFPTYSYFRMYKHGDVLAKHTDRSACEISVSLCLGTGENDSWPLWIEGPRGTSCINLNPGDALLYRGIECAHWREAFKGTSLAQSFLHYVDQTGPYAHWKFDKRPSSTALPRSFFQIE